MKKPNPKNIGHIADRPEGADVLGSYTGMTIDGEPPVQDADDL